ncbi:MAG TPA: methyltransferase domain-containing protein [Gemmatimonadaceae bacterium]|nr:methyltransferase domain-containing protein [Gemmatimonadaceae bacterium]
MSPASGPSTHDIEALRETLERRFRVERTEVDLGRFAITIAHPANSEELIDEEEFDQDERLPYWADLWPSARVLARHVAEMHADGRTLLELGCGSGLVAAAAARAGFAVTATDYYEDSLLFTRANVWAAASAARREALRTRLVDWRQFPQDLGQFDLVVASDVLYEHAYGPLVARAIARSLAPTGAAWLADPGRIAAEAFVQEAQRLGLEAFTAERVPWTDGEVQQTIDLYLVRWPRLKGLGTRD